MARIVQITLLERRRTVLLPFLLRHYKSQGVCLFDLILHVPPGEDYAQFEGEVEALASGIGVDTVLSPYFGVYETRVARQHMDKRQAVHQSADWIVWADSDEFHYYPGGLERILQTGADYVTGRLYDRFAPGGYLADTRPSIPLDWQFPLGAEFTSMVMRGDERKVAVAKPGVTLVPGQHVVVGDSWRRSDQLVTVHHFKWDASVRNRLSERLLPAWRRKHDWWVRSQTAVDQIRQDNRTIDVPRSARIGIAGHQHPVASLESRFERFPRLERAGMEFAGSE